MIQSKNVENGKSWRSKNVKSALVLAGLAACLAIAASLHVYYLTAGSGGEILWKGEEAYLFLGTGYLGYRVSYLEYPFDIIGEYFYRPTYTDDVRGSSLVIRITASSVEHHVVDYGYGWDAHSPSSVTPFDDGIYAICQGAILCKWTDDGFKPATEEQKHRLDGTNHLVRGDVNHQIVNGWQTRTTDTLGANGRLVIPLGASGTLSLENRGTNGPLDQWVVIKLLRPNQQPETLYDVNGFQRRVSRKEYEAAIRRP